MRRILITVPLALAVLLSVLGGPARAGAPQITDPALDYPPPFADLVSVELSVAEKVGGSSMVVKFTLAGDVIDQTRNLMYAYTLMGKVGKCELSVGFYAYPTATELAGVAPAGSAGAWCEGSTKEAAGTFQIEGPTITMRVPLADLPGFVKGATITDLRAVTSPGTGLNGDDTSAAGDFASTDKPWTIA